MSAIEKLRILAEADFGDAMIVANSFTYGELREILSAFRTVVDARLKEPDGPLFCLWHGAVGEDGCLQCRMAEMKRSIRDAIKDQEEGIRAPLREHSTAINELLEEGYDHIECLKWPEGCECVCPECHWLNLLRDHAGEIQKLLTPSLIPNR